MSSLYDDFLKSQASPDSFTMDGRLYRRNAAGSHVAVDTLDMTRVRCTDCGWLGFGYQLAAQACPVCDGRVGEEGSPEFEAKR